MVLHKRYPTAAHTTDKGTDRSASGGKGPCGLVDLRPLFALMPPQPQLNCVAVGLFLGLLLFLNFNPKLGIARLSFALELTLFLRHGL
jgi:hypothetical protein